MAAEGESVEAEAVADKPADELPAENGDAPAAAESGDQKADEPTEQPAESRSVRGSIIGALNYFTGSGADAAPDAAPAEGSTEAPSEAAAADPPAPEGEDTTVATASAEEATANVGEEPIVAAAGEVAQDSVEEVEEDLGPPPPKYRLTGAETRSGAIGAGDVVLKAGKKVATLGMKFGQRPPLPLVVKEVESGSWAEEQGIQAGDVFVRVNGRNCDQLINAKLEYVMNSKWQRPISFQLLMLRNADLEAGIYRYEFFEEESESLGVSFSGSFRPRVLEVKPDSLAAAKGILRGYEVHAVNGELLEESNWSDLMAKLSQRPVALDLRPRRQAKEAICGVLDTCLAKIKEKTVTPEDLKSLTSAITSGWQAGIDRERLWEAEQSLATHTQWRRNLAKVKTVAKVMGSASVEANAHENGAAEAAAGSEAPTSAGSSTTEPSPPAAEDAAQAEPTAEGAPAVDADAKEGSGEEVAPAAVDATAAEEPEKPAEEPEKPAEEPEKPAEEPAAEEAKPAEADAPEAEEGELTGVSLMRRLSNSIGLTSPEKPQETAENTETPEA